MEHALAGLKTALNANRAKKPRIEGKMETLCIIASAIVLGSIGVLMGISGWVIATTMLGAGVGVAAIVLFIAAVNMLLDLAEREYDGEDEDDKDENATLSNIGEQLDAINRLRREKGL